MSDTVSIAAAAPSSSLDSAFSSPACGTGCIMAVGLSSAGVLLGALIGAVVIVRRRRNSPSSTTSTSNFFKHTPATTTTTARDMETGKFEKYKPAQPPATQTVLSRLDADEDLVDVLDLFDAPAMAHLRSPSARRLTNNTSTWGPEWRMLNEPGTTPRRRSRGPSNASDQIGIQTMLEQDSLSIRGSSMYAARTPVLVPRNLDHLQSLPKISVNALTSQVSAKVKSAQSQHAVGGIRRSDRPNSLYRDKRPPPLQLARSNTSTANPSNRCSYISIKSVPNQQNALHNAGVMEKPVLSPITPLITPPIRSPATTTANGKMRVPGSSRRTSISRGDAIW